MEACMAHDQMSIISIIKHTISIEHLASPPVEVWKCLFASAPCDGGRGYS
jgi:hypothetical protein